MNRHRIEDIRKISKEIENFGYDTDEVMATNSTLIIRS